MRLAQTQLLLTEVERMSFHWNSKGNAKYWPIIITGDFNSTPNSTVYELIVKGVLKYDHLAEKKMHQPGSPRHGNVLGKYILYCIVLYADLLLFLVPSHLQITDACQHASLVHNRRKNEDMSRVEEAAHIKLHNSDKTISKISDQIIKNPSLFSSGTLSHLFALKSVYQHGEPDDPEGNFLCVFFIIVLYCFISR